MYNLYYLLRYNDVNTLRFTVGLALKCVWLRATFSKTVERVKNIETKLFTYFMLYNSYTKCQHHWSNRNRDNRLKLIFVTFDIE